MPVKVGEPLPGLDAIVHKGLAATRPTRRCRCPPLSATATENISRSTLELRCRIRGAANNRPITVTDVRSDGRPRDVPGDSLSAQHLRAAAAAERLLRRRHGAEAVGRQQPHVP
eukprot:scaffold7393_cov101-Isochrysis_galbana.AAC.1